MAFRLPCSDTIVSTHRVLAVTLAALSSTTFVAAKDMALVSNKSNSVTTITMPELVKICKGQTKQWPDGKPVTFITRDPAAADMKLVLDKIYGIPKNELSNVIAAANHGRINHPAILVVNSDASLVQKVESIPGAVGLVDVYSITSGVAVVRIGGKLPFEAGYPLHGN
jgi:ABC-type phosphate transport system substrate-binding protein